MRERLRCVVVVFGLVAFGASAGGCSLTPQYWVDVRNDCDVEVVASVTPESAQNAHQSTTVGPGKQEAVAVIRGLDERVRIVIRVAGERHDVLVASSELEKVGRQTVLYCGAA